MSLGPERVDSEMSARKDSSSMVGCLLSVSVACFLPVYSMIESL
jgi:hypothetical protein